MTRPDQHSLLRLREALEASWDRQTAYGAVEYAGNPALGQCYPTARVVQHYYPLTEILKGEVWTGFGAEIHFWNHLCVDGTWHCIDLTWQQFPKGSIIRHAVALDRNDLQDSDATRRRCALLLGRVKDRLAKDRLAKDRLAKDRLAEIRL